MIFRWFFWAVLVGINVAHAADSITLSYQPLADGGSVMNSYSSEFLWRQSQKAQDGKIAFGDGGFSQSAIKHFVQRSRSGTGRTFDVFYAHDTTVAGALEHQQEKKSDLHGNKYTLVIENGSVSVHKEQGQLSDKEQQQLTQNFHDGRIGMDLFGTFTSGRTFVVGQSVALSKDVLDMLGAKAGTLEYVGQYERWHRPVAEFQLQLSNEMRLKNNLTASGTLIVDVNTGRPLLLTALGEFGRSEFTEFNATWVREQGIARWHSSWNYSGMLLNGLDIEVKAKTAPAGKVVGMAISPDGNALAMTSQLPESDNQTVTLYDVSSQTQVFTTAAMGEHIAFSSTGGKPYFAHMGKQGLLLGGFLSGSQVQPFGKVMLNGAGINLSAQSMVLVKGYPVVATSDNKLQVLNIGWGKLVGEWPLPSRVVQLATDASETRIATLDEAGVIRIYQPEIDRSACNKTSTGWCEGAKLADMVLLAESGAKYPGMRSLQLHPDKLQVAGTVEAGIVVLDVASGAETRIAQAGSSVRFDAKGERLFTERGIWRISGQNLKKFDVPANYHSDILAVAPDGGMLYRSARSGYGVEMVDAEQGSVIAMIRANSPPVLGAIMAGENMYSLSSRQRVNWDFRNLNVEAKPLSAPVSRLGVSAGKSRVFAFHDMNSHAVSVVNGAQVFSIPFRNTLGDPFQLSDDGAKLAISLPDGSVEIWDVARQALSLTAQIAGYSGAMRAMLFHPEKDYLYFLSGSGELGLFDLTGKQRLATTALKLHGTPLLALSPDASLLAVSSVADETGVWNQAIPLVRMFDGNTLAAVRDMHPQWGNITAMRFTHDGKQLLGGDDTGRIDQWDVASGINVIHMMAHSDAITGLYLSDDGSQYATASEDGLVKLWKTRESSERFASNDSAYLLLHTLNLDLSSKAIATLAYVGDSDYVITVPDGYYTASLGALQKTGFVQNGKVFDFEQFDLWMNRPDVILQRLGFADQESVALFHAAFLARLKRLGIKDAIPDMASLKPPQLEVQGNAGAVTDADAVVLSLTATAEKYGLNKLRINVNSVPVYSGGGKKITGKAYGDKATVKLSRGLNRIQVSVLDENGLESQKRSLKITRKAEQKQPELWLLAVGVSDYLDDRLDLKMAAKDAGDIARFFQHSGQFAKTHVMTLTDRQATSAHIRDARKFLETAGIDDQIIVFFAGHGFLSADQSFYFGSTDINPDKPSTGLSYDHIVALVDGLSSRKKVVLIDSCHSGEAYESETPLTAKVAEIGGGVRAYSRGFVRRNIGGGGRSIMLMRDKFADLRQNSGAIVLSAAGGDEYALESREWNNGVFTYSVLDGLSGHKADLSQDGIVSAKELRSYVYGKVNELTKGRQHPTTREENLDLDFPLF